MAPKCTCSFGPDTVSVEEELGGNEALAGAVGALSSALLTGGAVGIWQLVRGRKNPIDLDDGTESESPPVKRSPPPYSNDSAPVTARNVYKAGINDSLTHQVSQQRTTARATDF